ncbi:MAG: hypothetical protein JEZ00_11020 [Anaerolineaceae bacterium]|nr:hypothetical protein [Anaerolineaceae bacterium]
MNENTQEGMDRPINFAILARFTARIEFARLQDALHRLEGRHYAFEHGNLRLAEGLALLKSRPFPMMEIVDCHDKSWQEISVEELSVTFPADGPYIRCKLLQKGNGSDLVMVFDHQVCDGLSGVILLRDLYILLNDLELKLSALPVPPAIWEILPKAIQQNVFSKFRLALFMKYLDFKKWRKRHQPMEQEVWRYRIEAFDLSAEKSEAFISRCKQEKTSVHAAISVAWMMSLQKFLIDRNKSAQLDKNPKLRSVSSPVSLRDLLPTETQDCAGMFYSTVVTALDFSRPFDFWENARRVKKQMDEERSKITFFDMPLFFKSMYQRQSKLPDGETFNVPDFPVDYDFSISNMGRLDGYFVNPTKSGPAYQIDAIYGPMVNAFAGEKTVGVCMINGKIHFVLTTFVGDMKESEIEKLCFSVAALLENQVGV